MAKQSIPNNPVVLLQQNLQVLRTITSQADENTPITAFIAMQKNTIEVIRIMQTHDKGDDFTMVPKAVVSLCRLVISQNVLTLERGILEHRHNKAFVVTIKAKIATYKNILSRLPDVPEPPAGEPLQKPPADEPCETCESYTTGECVSEVPCDLNYSAFKPCQAPAAKPPGLRSDVKLSTKTNFEIERKKNGPDRQTPTNRK